MSEPNGMTEFMHHHALPFTFGQAAINPNCESVNPRNLLISRNIGYARRPTKVIQPNGAFCRLILYKRESRRVPYSDGFIDYISELSINHPISDGHLYPFESSNCRLAIDRNISMARLG